jgi:NAD(P)-dependent dehydrogenase (short-subunit alcohol dehydrogenase family)
MRLDVMNYDEWQHVVNTVREKYGRIDILMNNAGVIDLEEPGDLSKMDTILNVNLKGVIMGCNAVLPTMMEQRYGKIINISDTAAMISWPKTPTYSAAKGGVIALTRCYAGHLGQYNININAVVPGPIETQMLDEMLAKLGMSKEELSHTIPKGRIGSPWDVANAVTFLASDEADYITGQILIVDGGCTVR